MKTPSFVLSACKGARELPEEKSPTCCVKPPAKEKMRLKGTYSPKGTKWTLSYRAVNSPAGFTSDAELNNACPGFPSSYKATSPANTQFPVCRANVLKASRKGESLS